MTSIEKCPADKLEVGRLTQAWAEGALQFVQRLA